MLKASAILMRWRIFLFGGVRLFENVMLPPEAHPAFEMFPA